MTHAEVTGVPVRTPVRTPGRPSNPPSSRLLPTVLVTVSLACVGTNIGASMVAWGRLLTINEFVWVVGWLVFAVVGAIVLRRHDRHPMGWLFLAIGVLGSLMDAATSYAVLGTTRHLPGDEVAGWLATWMWAPPLGLIVMALGRFPTGRTIGRVWTVVGWVAVGATCVMALANLVGMWPLRSPELALPDSEPHLGVWWMQVAAMLQPVFLLAAAATMLSLGLRARRARGVDRQQLKWLGLWGIVAGPALILGQVLSQVLGRESGVYLLLDLLSAPAWLAVAAGLAILRFHLYDIDRFVSRTLSYGIVTGLLVGLYALGVLAMGAVLPDQGSDLVVAASTLGVAALFGPLRRRVQALVDRRFNRGRYDAGLVVAAFVATLRDDIDQRLLSRDLCTTVGAAVHPTTVSLWLPAAEGTG